MGSIMSRALSLLAGFASPVFLCAAVAGWLFELWPANPLTLGVAGLLVVGGPIVGIVHVATAKDDDEEAVPDTAEQATVALTPPALARRPAPAPARRVLEPAVMTPRAAAAARFAAWRDTPHPAIAQRERERRASRYIRG